LTKAKPYDKIKSSKGKRYKTMMRKIETESLRPAELDALYAEGFRFRCEGDYQILRYQFDRDGMPIMTNNTYVFDDFHEANVFAEKQIYPINPSIHAFVREIPAHTETWEEKEAKRAKAKEEAKIKREAKKAELAKKAGMTVAEYEAEQKRKATIKRKEKAIADLKNEIEADKRRLERMEAELAELLK
jgi:hypothetical protein